MKIKRKSITACVIGMAMALGVVTVGSTAALATAAVPAPKTSAATATSSNATAAKKKKKKLTRAQKLKAALKACKKDKKKSKRKSCETTARKKFGKPKITIKTITKTVTNTVEKKVEVPVEKRVDVPVETPPPASTLPKELGEGPKETGSSKAIENPSEIPVAPAFTPTQLNAWPTGNWIGPEGGTTGDHYSNLSEINTENISELKADWMTQLDKSAVASKYSAEASPTEYEGVDYYVTGADDVFAVSVASGKILWVHPGNLPATVGTAVCCGWDARGVSIGNGLVFAPVLSGSVEALNQKTGQLVWETELGTPSEGFTVTSAPLYYEGMVYIGPVGSEYGVRGFMVALKATTGEMVWKHYNIPAPGETGSETWPHNTSCTSCNAEWQHGGATTWNAPTVNPKLGLIYYSTANAGNDNDGTYRPGDNLWSVSMLALNYKTGEMAWGYQEVHHDVWDYDASNQPTMINAEINGKKVEGLVQADKDGFAYFVNDETGKPVFPIEEESVPANPINQNSATQPIPTMPPFYPQKTEPAEVEALQKSINTAAAAKKETPPTVVHGGYHEDDVFGAWAARGESKAQISSDALSGDNEAPSSFDPQNDYYYVCSRKGLDYVYVSEGGEPTFKEGSTFEESGWLVASNIGTPGYLTAYNMKTGTIAWQETWPHSCYSGITTTAGNILFVGTVEGNILAYNATTGKQLWSFSLGSGVGGPESIYEFGGKERLGIYAGGNEFGFADDAEGDNLWQFSLNGTGPGPIEYGKTPAPPLSAVPTETTDY